MYNFSFIFQVEHEPGVVEKVRAEAVECAALYALKYGEEFSPHAPAFVTAAWEALVDAGPQPKYDTVTASFYPNSIYFILLKVKHNTYFIPRYPKD